MNSSSVHLETEERVGEKCVSIPFDDSTNTSSLHCSSSEERTINDVKDLKVFIGSWNVGNSCPPNDLTSWLPSSVDDYDLIVIGLQECQYETRNETTVANKMKSSNNIISKLEARASSVLNATLSSLSLLGVETPTPFLDELETYMGEKFTVAVSVELVEMRLIVFVHKRNTFGDLEHSTEATGIGSVVGNKGGCVAKIVVNENTSLVFVSCHLAAHEAQKFLDKRNSDCAEIIQGARVGNKSIDLDSQFHHAFWFGDLNYRIDPTSSSSTTSDADQWTHVHALINKHEWNVLNDMDQLKRQMIEKKTLSGFILPKASFPPTFKVIRNEKWSYTTQRIPSYCDRILYKSLPAYSENIELLEFTSCPEITTSDHKPVSATFKIQPVTVPVKTKETTSIVFEYVNGHDLLPMDINGVSDPYFQLFLDQNELVREGSARRSSLPAIHSTGTIPSSTVQRGTLNPKWIAPDLPHMDLHVSNLQDLLHLHVILVIRDYDAVKSDDPLGQCILPLGDCTHDDPDGTMSLVFNTPVYLYGKPAGRLTGKLRITFPAQQKRTRKSNTSNLLQDATLTGCHCSLS